MREIPTRSKNMKNINENNNNNNNNGKKNQSNDVEMGEAKRCKILNDKTGVASNCNHEDDKLLLISDPSDEATSSNVEDSSVISKHNNNKKGNTVENEEEKFPMLRTSSRRRGRKQQQNYRNNGGQSFKKSKAKKDEAAQISLISKIRSMIKQARYEIEVDTYRGIFDNNKSNADNGHEISSNSKDCSRLSYKNSFQQCTQKQTFYLPPQTKNQIQTENIRNNNFYDTFQCPCLQSWTIHPENLTTNKDNHSSEEVDSNQKKHSQYQHTPKPRPISSEFQCVCDYNPLCIMSLGGAMDDYLYEIFQKTQSDDNLQKHNDSNYPIVDDEDENFDSSTIDSSVENGSMLISPTSLNIATSRVSSHNIEENTPSLSKKKNNNQNNNITPIPIKETKTNKQTIIIDTIDEIEDVLPQTIQTSLLNQSKGEDNKTRNQNYIINNGHSNVINDSKHAGEVFTKYTRQNIMNLFDQLEFNNSKYLLEARNETKINKNIDYSRNNAIAMGDIEFSQLRKSNWTTQESIEEYLKKVVFSENIPKSSRASLSPMKNKIINLDVEKCLGIICAWHKYLAYTNPDHNTELNPYFQLWLPPTQQIGQCINFDDTHTNRNDSEDELVSYSSSKHKNKNEIEKKIKLAKPPGMKNLGATCYLNSQFQCLAQNPVFTVGVFSWNAKRGSDNNVQSQNDLNNNDSNIRMNQILYSMQLLLSRMIYGPKNIICTNEFSIALGLENNEMQDPNEFTRLLFDRMHESFEQSSLLMESDSKEPKKKKNLLGNLLPRLFGGICHYETTCLECSQKSTRKEDFMDLTLPIVGRNNNNNIATTDKSNKCANSSLIICDDDDLNDYDFIEENPWNFRDTTLQICLDTYLQPETLDGENQYFCNKCNAKCNARRNVSFARLPQVFNIQLARYVFDRKALEKRKLTNRVLLPRTLLVPQIAHRYNNIDNQLQERLKTDYQYILCAVQNHRGKSAYGGHYVAEAMDWTTGVWYEYNDENVTLLPNGPNSSYCPLVPEEKRNKDINKYNSFTDDDDSGTEKDSFNVVEINTEPDKKKDLIRGSTDAYNLFYVEKSFLTRCAKRQLLLYHDHVKTLKSSTPDNGDTLEIRHDAIFKVTNERLETYKIMSQLYSNVQNSSERLLRRKAGILRFLIPHLVKMNQIELSDESKKDSHDNDNNEEKIWVDGSIFRRFMSCNDEMNEIFSEHIDQPLLRNKDLICEHGEGLHPCTARTGKILNKQAYNAYISLMCGEKEYVNKRNSSGGRCIPVTTDCLITTKKNLFCSTCAQNYRANLEMKVKEIELLLKLQDDLNSAPSDVDPNDINDEKSAIPIDTPLYAISRSFLTSFRKHSQHKLKELVGMNKDRGSKNYRSSVCSLEGIDKIDFGDISSKETASISSSINEKKTCLDGKDETTINGQEKLDQCVNTKIICPHGNLSTTNRRFVRYVPSFIWDKIQLLFPRAISLQADFDVHTKINIALCKKCREEKDRMLQLEHSLRSWANDILFSGEQEKEEPVTKHPNILRGLFTEDKAQSSKHCDKSNYSDITTQTTFFIVHKRDVSAWRSAIRIIQSKKKTKLSKGSTNGDMLTELTNFMFEKPSDILQSNTTYDNVKETKRDLSFVQNSDTHMKIDNDSNVTWNMRRLLCKEHKRAVGAPRFFTDILDAQYQDITDDGHNVSSSKCRNLGDYDIDPSSMKTCWELLKPLEYDAFISSINKLSLIFSLFKQNNLNSEINNNLNNEYGDYHPKVILQYCAKDIPENRPSSHTSSGSMSSSAFNLGIATNPRRLELIPQLCTNKECINRLKGDKCMSGNVILNFIVSPAMVDEPVVADQPKDIPKDSPLEIKPSIDSIQMKVHEFEEMTSVVEMCEIVKNRILDANRRKNIDNSVRRSKRKRKSINSKEELIHEFPFPTSGNLARLRLMINERSETISLIDQKLFIICPHSFHGSKLNYSDKGSERIPSLDDISCTSMVGTVEHELSNEWNVKEFSHILSTLSNAEDASGPSLSFGQEIHIILCRVGENSTLNMSSDSKKSARPNQTQNETRQEMEEAVFESLMDMSNISQSSPLVFKRKNCMDAPVSSTKKTRTERGFRGTFLQSNIPEQSKKSQVDYVKPKEPIEEIIIIDTEKNLAPTKDECIGFIQVGGNDYIDSPNSTECINDGIVVDISSDSSSDGSIFISGNLNFSTEVKLVNPGNKSCVEVKDLEAQNAKSPLRSNFIETEDDSSCPIQVEKHDSHVHFGTILSKNDSVHLSFDEDSNTIFKQKPTRPTSWYDLSPPALSFTEPLNGNNENIAIPSLIREHCEMESLSKEEARQFVICARNIFHVTLKENHSSTSPKIEELIQLLPTSLQDTDTARHLYRNFVDSVDTLFENSNNKSPCEKIYVSRREMDIMLYFISIKKDYKVCHLTLMPYRKCTDVKKMFTILLEKEYHNKYSTYMEHVHHCVRTLLDLEEEGAQKLSKNSNNKDEAEYVNNVESMKQNCTIDFKNTFVEELAQELSKTISSDYHYLAEKATKSKLVEKFRKVLKSTDYLNSEWKAKKQEFLDEVLASLLNES